MDVNKRSSTIIFAEDNPADQLLVQQAFKLAGVINPIVTVNDGLELLDYLRGKGDYSDRLQHPPADLVLMDLEMARMDGRRALSLIKEDPALKHLPIVIMTASSDEADVYLAYEWGAASFMTKPADIDSWAQSLRVIAEYWLHIVIKPTDFRQRQ